MGKVSNITDHNCISSFPILQHQIFSFDEQIFDETLSLKCIPKKSAYTFSFFPGKVEKRYFEPKFWLPLVIFEPVTATMASVPLKPLKCVYGFVE
jgi:hypothetical protein